MTGQVVEIKSMQGLSHLEHHEIGDIDDVVDRSLPDRSQSLLQPVRRGADGHIFDQARCIARAEIRCFDGDRGLVMDSRAVAAGADIGKG